MDTRVSINQKTAACWLRQQHLFTGGRTPRPACGLPLGQPFGLPKSKNGSMKKGPLEAVLYVVLVAVLGAAGD